MKLLTINKHLSIQITHTISLLGFELSSLPHQYVLNGKNGYFSDVFFLPPLTLSVLWGISLLTYVSVIPVLAVRDTLHRRGVTVL